MTTIEVTQRDIDHGVPTLCGYCPIAIAITKLVKRGVRVEVKERLIWFKTEGAPFAVDVPEAASTFMRRFDTNLPVTTFSFELDIPSEYLREAA